MICFFSHNQLTHPFFFFFFFNDTATTEIYTLSLHDALPTSRSPPRPHRPWTAWPVSRSWPPPRRRDDRCLPMSDQGLRTGELAQRAEVNVQTLRYYERRGLLALRPTTVQPTGKADPERDDCQV